MRSSANQRLAALFAKRNYELLGELGRGGMGIVYLAKHTKLDRKVAIKTLSPDRAARENSLRRFEREARTFAQIRHPNIAALFEFEDAGPLQYLALEYIDGYDLESERRRGKKWPAAEAARIIATVAGALDYTHEKEILHRDIKPGNILIERETNRVVLTDFGLAKSRKDETLTASGFAVGTPAYMAPEQISDQFNVRPDGRSDIFSLGTVLYEMLTAKHPFLGADDLKTMRNIVHNDAVPVNECEPGVPAALAQIVQGMLQKHPDHRFATAKQVQEILMEFVEEDGRIDTGKLPANVRPKSDKAAAAPARERTPAPVKAAAPAASAQTPAPTTSTTSVQGAARGAGRSMSTGRVITIAVLVGLGMMLIGVIVGKMLF